MTAAVADLIGFVVLVLIFAVFVFTVVYHIRAGIRMKAQTLKTVAAANDMLNAFAGVEQAAAELEAWAENLDGGPYTVVASPTVPEIP